MIANIKLEEKSFPIIMRPYELELFKGIDFTIHVLDRYIKYNKEKQLVPQFNYLIYICNFLYFECDINKHHANFFVKEWFKLIYETEPIDTDDGITNFKVPGSFIQSMNKRLIFVEEIKKAIIARRDNLLNSKQEIQTQF